MTQLTVDLATLRDMQAKAMSEETCSMAALRKR